MNTSYTACIKFSPPFSKADCREAKTTNENSFICLGVALPPLSAPTYRTRLNNRECCSEKSLLKNCLSNFYDEHVQPECIGGSDWASTRPRVAPRCLVIPGTDCLSQFRLSVHLITCLSTWTFASGTWLFAKWNLFYRPPYRPHCAPLFNGTFFLLTLWDLKIYRPGRNANLFPFEVGEAKTE